jgi:hypothetical protein
MTMVGGVQGTGAVTLRQTPADAAAHAASGSSNRIASKLAPATTPAAGVHSQVNRPREARGAAPASMSAFALEPDKTVYLPKTNHWDGQPAPVRKEILLKALRAAGPNGRLEIEVLGSYGDYLAELKPLLREALKSIPRAEWPQLSGFFSGLMPERHAPLAQAALAQKNGVLGPGTYGRLAVNLGNDAVFKVVQDRVQSFLSFASELGVRPNVSVDDHFAVPSPYVGTAKEPGAFLKANALTRPDQGQALMTRRLDQIRRQVNQGGGDFTISLVGTMKSAGETLVDAPAIARSFGSDKRNAIEFQAYRDTPKSFQDMLDTVYTEIIGSADALKNVATFRIAVCAAPNGKPLSGATMARQLEAFRAFQGRVADAARTHHVGDDRWKVQISLFALGDFYQLPWPADGITRLKPGGGATEGPADGR